MERLKKEPVFIITSTGLLFLFLTMMGISLFDPEFFKAIEQYINQEKVYVASAIEELSRHLPFKLNL